MGRCPKVYFHWSGRPYSELDLRHHININFDGTIHQAKNFSKPLTHTPMRSIAGISICLLGGDEAYLTNSRQVHLGPHPLTEKQITTGIIVAAHLLFHLELNVSTNTLLTSSEAANDCDRLRMKERYGIGHSINPVWDMSVLHEHDPIDSAGNILRYMVQTEIAIIKQKEKIFRLTKKGA